METKKSTKNNFKEDTLMEQNNQNNQAQAQAQTNQKIGFFAKLKLWIRRHKLLLIGSGIGVAGGLAGFAAGYLICQNQKPEEPDIEEVTPEELIANYDAEEEA